MKGQNTSKNPIFKLFAHNIQHPGGGRCFWQGGDSYTVLQA